MGKLEGEMGKVALSERRGRDKESRRDGGGDV